MTDLSGQTRPLYAALADWLAQIPAEQLANRRQEAEAFFRRIGITFAVYGDEQGTERLIPFDVIPRLLDSGEWRRLADGLEQRVLALNAFIADCYGPREAVKAGIVPEDLILRNAEFRPEMTRIKPPGGIYVHVAGIDIVRVDANDFYVLEDNCRTPSGVSYMLENREAMLRVFPDLFSQIHIRPIDDYPDKLKATLSKGAPPPAEPVKPAPAKYVCPSCKTEFAQPLKFCGECGKPMKAARA